MDGIQLIAKEREKQLEKWSIEHDLQEHSNNQLVFTAVNLLLCGYMTTPKELCILIKTYKLTPKERLVVAGALIAAEIDRLDYEEQVNEK